MTRIARVPGLARGEADKLSFELRTLYRQFFAGKGAPGRAAVRHSQCTCDRNCPCLINGLRCDKPGCDCLSAAQGPAEFAPHELLARFGIQSNQADPSVAVGIALVPEADLSAIERAGTRVLFQSGNLAYASIPVLRLDQLARQEEVTSVHAVNPGQIPRLPPRARPKVLTRRVAGVTRGRAPGDFDRQGYTGKGAIVAVVDTGIDWKHADFINADGSSRILALWDLTDPSWKKSQGAAGSEPPQKDPDTGEPMGTLYSAEQINKALQGKGVVGSTDRVGHGTACAGTGAGNGRATGGDVPVGTYMGVAPEAELIVVKAATDDGDFSEHFILGTHWAMEYARSLGKPCVVNQSFGGHYSAHDGTDPEEKLLDGLVGPGRSGLAICTSAGNESRESFHASGRFGPKRPETGNPESPPIELFLSRSSALTAYFQRGDDWGLAIQGLDAFFVDSDGKPMEARFFRGGERVEMELWGKQGAKPKAPANFSTYTQRSVATEQLGDNTERLIVVLMPGKYLVRGFGGGVTVASGRFDLYLPSVQDGSFGKGAEHRFLIGSPGNAANTITVGAYDFRASWENLDGKQTSYNLVLGDLADYSSPGYRRDGAVKPDVVAPATYTISALAADCKMGKVGQRADGKPDSLHITHDGRHLAWSGTSAASPYVAGVVALMLEKNPTLDAAQIKKILIDTCTRDSFTGSLPNPSWGNGKLNPEAALRATPSSSRAATLAEGHRRGAARQAEGDRLAPRSQPAGGGQSTAQSGSNSRKRAVLVGVSDYKRGQSAAWDDLHCRPDVENLRTVLRQRFGFPESQILVLTDAKATRQGILRAFRTHLVDPARPGDVVYFHFSGHGQPIRDDDGDELDGMDESLVPFDYISRRASDGEKTNLRDDELAALLRELKQRMRGPEGRVEGGITVSVDSCYSGTATRGRLVARGRGWDVDLDGPLPAPRRSAAGAPDGASGLLAPGEAVARGYVLVSACQDSQQAMELPDLGGAFTHHLCRALARASPQTTYRALFERVSVEVAAEIAEQNPQLEGERDHLLFAGTARPVAPYVLVQRVEECSTLVLPVGALHGVTEGSRYAIYRGGSDVRDERNRLATAVIREVDLTESRARMAAADVRRLRLADLKAARAVETAHNYSERRLRVLAESGTRSAAPLLTLDMITMHGVTAQNYDVLVRRAEGKLILERKSGSVLADIPENGAVAERLRAALLREWRWQFLAQLRSEDGDPTVKVDLRLVPLDVEIDGEGNLVRVVRDRAVQLSDGSYPLLHDGDHVMIEVRNRSTTAVYVTILALHPDGGIAPIFPHPLAPGVRDNLRPNDDTWFRISGTRPEEFVLVMGQPYGMEVFKLIATRNYADFSPLFHAESMRQRGEAQVLAGYKGVANPLARLLLTAADGRRRGGGSHSLPRSLWSVTDLPFLVRPG